MNKLKVKNQREKRRAKRTRANIFGTSEKPRFSVYRTNQYLYAQLIDDTSHKTLLSGSTRDIKDKDTKVNKSTTLGEALAKKAKDLGISQMVFDRGSYRYHGRVKSIAEALRTSGIKI